MKRMLPLAAAALAIGAVPLAVSADSFSGNDGHRPMGLYERIAAHYGPMGRDVKEEFRDGPCKIERKWEVDGDYEEKIECRGPRD